MNFSFECVQCEADFDLEVPDLVKDPSLVVCPNCGVKADARIIESAVSALDEMLSQFSRLRRRFRVYFALESDEFDDEIPDEYVAEEDDEETLWSNEPEDEEDEE